MRKLYIALIIVLLILVFFPLIPIMIYLYIELVIMNIKNSIFGKPDEMSEMSEINN